MDRFSVLQNGAAGITINRKGRGFYPEACKKSGRRKEEAHLVSNKSKCKIMGKSQ